MSPSKNARIVKAFFAATYAGEFDRAFRDYVHQTFRWAVGSPDDTQLRAAIPWAGHVHAGQEGYVRLTNAMFSDFEVVSFEAHRYSETVDTVFVEGHFSFRHRKSGRLANSDWLARFDLKDERIAGGQFYENTYAVAAARADS